MAKRKVLRGGQKVLGTLSSGAGDDILTRDPSTKEIGVVPAIDPSVYLSTSLLDGRIFIGNSSNLATPVGITGAILISNIGVSSIASNIITDNNIFSAAGIQYSKLNLANSIVNNDIANNANIARTKLLSGNPFKILINDSSGIFSEQTAITPNRVLISDANGLPIDSTLTTTVLSYVDPTSPIQNQLNNRLTFSSTIVPAEGDLIVYQSGIWNSFPKGASGQYLTSTVGGLSWVTTPNGLPSGGAANEILRKIDSTDYNTEWHTLSISDLSDITANAAQINVLASTFYDATSSIQTQFNSKLNNALANNSLFVGNASNQAAQLSPGTSGQVLTIVAGVPQWQTISGTGTVTSVALSGGSTGLSVTGSPITTNGTITLTGTINPTHGGTGLTTYTTGDLLYASASNVLSSLGIGTNMYVLTVVGGIPTWQANAGASVLTTKGDLFTYDTGNQRLPIGTDGYILTADSGQATGMKWALPISEPFTDNIAIIKNNADNTKLVKFDASIISTATTRTYTLPDFSGTVALLGSTNGAALSKVDDTNVTITLSGNPNTALLAATSITLGWTGTLADGRIASSSNWNTAYNRSGTSLGFTSSTFTFTKQDASTLTVAVPTFNQNTTGSAAKWTTARNLAGNSVDGSANVAFANTFIVQGTTDSGLSGAQFLGSLATGIVKNTTTTGVLSIAVAGDFPTLNQNTTGSAGSVINTLTVDDSSIQLSSGTTYDGSAAKTISVKALGITNSLIANSTIDLTTKVTGVLPVANGGTNISSYTIGDIIYASGATTLSKLADVAAGSYLRSGGVTTVPVWSTITLPNSATTGDIIYASGTNTYSNLAVGGATTVLHGGATPSYSAVSLTTDVSGILPIANGGTGVSGGAFLLASGGTATATNTFAFGSNPWIVTTGVTTGTGATAGLQFVANSLTTGNGFDASTSSLTTGNLFKFASTSTAANSNTQTILNVATSGANSNSTQSTWGIDVSNTHTGTASTNIAMRLTASGGTNNYALITAGGYVGVGTSTPTGILHIVGSGSVPTVQTVGVGTGTNYSIRSFQSDASTEIFSLKDNGLFAFTPTVQGSTITSTWTATANNQFMGRFTGTATTENVNSDVIIGYQFDPNFTRNAGNPTGQSALGVYIKQPTTSNTLNAVSALIEGGNGYTTAALKIGNSSFTGSGAIYQTASNSLTIDAGNATAKIIMAVAGSNNVQINSAVLIGSSAYATTSGTLGVPTILGNQTTTSLSLQGNFNGPAGSTSQTGVSIDGTFNGQQTSTGKFLAFGGAINLNANATNVTIYGLDYNPTLTNTTGLGTHYGLLVRPIATLSGFGVSTPTARLELGGAMSSSSWTTVGIQMAFDAATYTDTGTAGTRATGVAIGIAQPTFAGTNAVIVTDAATVYIANAVAAGTNITLTRTHALWVAAGLARFDGGIKGTTTNDAATAGNYGEEVNSTVSTYTNYTTTVTYQNITSITLTAGDWDISAFATFSSNGATITGASNAIFVISTTSASATGSTEGVNISYVPQAALLGTSLESITIAPYRVSLSGTTTYYLNTQAAFTLGNPQFVGSIRARRHR